MVVCVLSIVRMRRSTFRLLHESFDRGTVAISTDVARDLDGAGVALIKRIIPNLNLLADLLHADVLLFARAGSQVEVLAHAQPAPVPSAYQDSLAARRLRREQVQPVARLLFQGRPPHDVQGAVVSGVPIVRE